MLLLIASGDNARGSLKSATPPTQVQQQGPAYFYWHMCTYNGLVFLHDKETSGERSDTVRAVNKATLPDAVSDKLKGLTPRHRQAGVGYNVEGLTPTPADR